MKNLAYLFLIYLIMGMSSCSEDNQSIAELEESTFIFGSYNGFCQGNCAHLFKYENGEVFRDEMDRFDDSNLTFSSSAENDLVDVAKMLFSEFPEFLKESNQETYGCPGCLDQSTLYVRIGEGNSSQSWRLDSIEQEDWPRELKDYVKLLKTELEQIIVF